MNNPVPAFTEEQLARCRGLAERVVARADEQTASLRKIRRGVQDAMGFFEGSRFSDAVPRGSAVFDAFREMEESFSAMQRDSHEQTLDLELDHGLIADKLKRLAALYAELGGAATTHERRVALWRQLGEPDLDNRSLKINLELPDPKDL